MQAKHVVVGGPSGGGKTTHLRQRHAEFDGLSVFLSTKPGERAEHSPPDRILKAGARYPEDIERTRAWARERPEPVQVIVDEVQDAPTFRGDDGPVRQMLHYDRDRGVKCVPATQNPQDLHTREWKYGPLQQAEYFVWVGEVKTWHSGFFDWLGVDSDQLPDENYEYHVIVPSDPPEVVYRGRTEREYA